MDDPFRIPITVTFTPDGFKPGGRGPKDGLDGNCPRPAPRELGWYNREYPRAATASTIIETATRVYFALLIVRSPIAEVAYASLNVI